jgi:ferritin-like metal-binding protein YciE
VLLGEEEIAKLLTATLGEEKAAERKLNQVAKRINLEAKAA